MASVTSKADTPARPGLRCTVAGVVAAAALLVVALPSQTAAAASPVVNAVVQPYFEPGHTVEGDFAYAPSSITEGGFQYHIYCGNSEPGIVTDSIYLATFANQGDQWVLQSDELVLGPAVAENGSQPWDSAHVCDPSVTSGDFAYDGVDYKYAMFYTGTNDPYGNGTQNSIGLAYSNDLIDWVRMDQPLVLRQQNEQWGVGQPSAITMDDGSVYLFYTRSNPTRTVWREITVADDGSLSTGAEHAVSLAGTQNIKRWDWAVFNADFAYDPATDRFWMVKPSGFDDASPVFVSTEVEVLSIAGDSLREEGGGHGMWQSIGKIDASITGEAKNHDAGFQRTAQGHLVDSDRIRVNVTTSPTAPFPDALFEYNLTAVTVPIGGLTDPFDADPSRMSAIDPYRAVDTRIGSGGRLADGETRRYLLDNTPAGATAVTLNVTAVQAAGGGFLVLWDCQGPAPETSNLNYLEGDTRANQVTIPINPTNAEVCVYSARSADLVIDVFAWYGLPSGVFNLSYVPRSPLRIYDSRQATKFAAEEVREFSIGALLPVGTTSVTFNLTTVLAEEASYATVWPCDRDRPTLSSLNTVRAAQTRANQVTVRLEAGDKFCVYSSKPQHMIIDLTGSWDGLQDKGMISQVPPRRWVDTRPTATPLAPGEIRQILPQQDQTIVGQLTATNTLGPGYYGLFPCADGYQGTSTVNFVGPLETASVAFYMPANRGGICIRSEGGGDMILDINGYVAL